MYRLVSRRKWCMISQLIIFFGLLLSVSYVMATNRYSWNNGRYVSYRYPLSSQYVWNPYTSYHGNLGSSLAVLPSRVSPSKVLLFDPKGSYPANFVGASPSRPFVFVTRNSRSINSQGNIYWVARGQGQTPIFYPVQFVSNKRLYPLRNEDYQDAILCAQNPSAPVCNVKPEIINYYQNAAEIPTN